MNEEFDKWDELKHKIDCDINWHLKKIEELSQESINHINHNMEVGAKHTLDKAIKHYHQIEELKALKEEMKDIEKMEEEDEE